LPHKSLCRYKANYYSPILKKIRDPINSHTLLSTFVFASFFGVFLVVLAQRLRITAIVPLLIGGNLLGPEQLGLVHPEALGEGLTTIISKAVGEGG